MTALNTETRKKRNIVLCICAVLLLLAGACAWEIHHSMYDLMTSYYEIPMRQGVDGLAVAEEGIRIVQLTDLHNSTFGEGNRDLVAQVAVEEPDLIFITGDLVNDKNGPDVSIAVDLIRHLTEIAPVYVSYGNQEATLEESAGLDFHARYKDAGAVVLDKEYVDVDVKGISLRIGGNYGYCLRLPYCEETNRLDEGEYLLDFQATDRYKLLLCHMPYSWVDHKSLYDYDIDCVLAGHAHGGQIRIPFIGGLWAPDQGWFPGRESGVYETSEEEWIEYKKQMLTWVEEAEKNRKKASVKTALGQNGGNALTDEPVYDYRAYYTGDLFKTYRPSYLVLSRGLGNTDWIPRFYNVPEVVVVEIR